MDQDQRQQVKRFLDILLRRKTLIFICIFLSVVIGLGYYIRTPKVYRSSSLIMYQQKINPTKMSPDSSLFQQIFSNVTQQITSRTSLENLITEFDLYKDRRARLPMEDVVDIMRSNDISIRLDRRGGNTFEVAYQGREPRTVLLVTNSLAAKFIEENIRLREETVSETSAYIKDELSMAKEAVNKKEAAMRDYKLKYYNEMPEQRETNISRLNALQIQYQGYQSNLQELERTKVLIQEQISLRQEILAKFGTGNTAVESTSDNNMVDSSASIEIAKLQGELDTLLTRYTDKHPDVRRLKSLIARLQEDKENQDETTAAGEQDTVPQNAEADNAQELDYQLYKMQKQIEEIDHDISTLDKEKGKMKEQIDTFISFIEAAPVREAEWTDLTRNYEQLNKHYEELVGRNIQAESAETLERRQKGSQFKIVDPAHFPEKPFYPDFLIIILMALGIGLGTGGAIALGLEMLDTSFRDAHDLERFLELPVTCSIPVIMTDKEKKRQHLKSAVGLTLFILSLTLLTGSIAFLWYKGIVII